MCCPERMNGDYPYKMGKLRLKTKPDGIPGGKCGKASFRTNPCGNSGKQSLRLSVAVIPEFATFRTEPEVISPGSEADVVITIDASTDSCGKGSFILLFLLL